MIIVLTIIALIGFGHWLKSTTQEMGRSDTSSDVGWSRETLDLWARMSAKCHAETGRFPTCMDDLPPSLLALAKSQTIIIPHRNGDALMDGGNPQVCLWIPVFSQASGQWGVYAVMLVIQDPLDAAGGFDSFSVKIVRKTDISSMDDGKLMHERPPWIDVPTSKGRFVSSGFSKESRHDWPLGYETLSFGMMRISWQEIQAVHRKIVEEARKPAAQ